MNQKIQNSTDRRLSRQLPVVIAMSAALSIASSYSLAGEDKTEFDISAQQLSSALIQFASQSNLRVVASSVEVADINIKGISGNLSPDKALEELLKGTGLSYHRTGNGDLVVKKVNAPEAEETVEADSVAEELEDMFITGSRIRHAKSTSPVITLDRVHIERLGVDTVEDVLRTVPQNISTVNSGTTSGGAHSSDPLVSVGQSAANLRGLGTGATLVLINGRRTATSAAFKDGTVNLSTIPASAVEQIEILLDGASAIYGSDAIGGVINIILRKDEVDSARTSVRYENSAHDGDSYAVTQTLSKRWDSGSAMLLLDYRDTDSVNSRKAGWESLDQRSRGGDDWRDNIFGRQLTPLPSPVGVYDPSLGDGSDTSHYVPVSPFDAQDVVASAASSDTQATSATLVLEQDLTDAVSVFTDMLYSRTENEAISAAENYIFFVPTNNAYNLLKQRVAVHYSFEKELKAGLIDPPSRSSDQDRININTGLHFELPYRDWKSTVAVNYSSDSGGSEFTKMGLLDLDTFSYIFAPNLEDAVDSSDPNTAINFFGWDDVTELDYRSLALTQVQSAPETDTRGIEWTADGSVMALAGGDLGVAVGASFREEGLEVPLDTLFDVNARDFKRDISAVFFEASAPLIGANNELPGIKELLLSLAGRWEEYHFEGQFSGADSSDEKTFSHFSPRVGLLWWPVEEINVTASWGESFRAPRLYDLFQPLRDLDFAVPIRDTNHPSGTDTDAYVSWWTGGNADLKPETSDTITVAVEWVPLFLDGLRVSATWTKIDWGDRITLLSPWDPDVAPNIAAFPELFERDADGNIVRITQKPINLASRIYEGIDATIDYDFETEWGSFTSSLTSVLTLKMEDTLVEGAETVERVETQDGPDRLVIRGHLGWSREEYGADLWANYTSSYENTLLEEATRVDHYTTFDLTGHYDLKNSWKIQAGVRNLLNNDFPFVNSYRTPWDSSRVDTRGRVIYMEVQKNFDL